MSTDHLPSAPSVGTSIGRFVRRLIWRREIGPVEAEARIEVRELNTDSEPQPKRDADTPAA